MDRFTYVVMMIMIALALCSSPLSGSGSLFTCSLDNANHVTKLHMYDVCIWINSGSK